MKKISLFFALLLFSSVYAGGRTEFQVSVGGNDCMSAWRGPGIYYNTYFNSPDDFYYWCQNPYWIGPGLYYGVWFDNQWDYSTWRRNNRYYGRHRYERREYRRHHDGHH